MEISQPRGIYDSANVKKSFKYKRTKEKNYRSSFLVSRLGDAIMPTEIEVHFTDNTDTLFIWDGKAQNKNFTFEGKKQIEWVKLDPKDKNLMDINIFNNSLTTDKKTTVINKYFTKFLYLVENIMLSLSMLF